MKPRLDNLRKKLEENQLDALLVTTPENRRYLSGFTGSAGSLLISRDKAILATDFRYIEQSNQEAPDFQVVKIGSDYKWFLDIVSDLKLKRVGLEAHNLSLYTYSQLTDTLKKASNGSQISLVSTLSIVDEIRSVKEPDEMAFISKAAEIADKALMEVVPTIQVGDPEREIGWRLEKAMREHGAEGMSFDIIVACGPNAALPHHHPSDKRIAAGETLVIDMGARYQGYCSDMTRTLCLGDSDDQLRRVYDIVLGAQLTAIATVEAGMSGGQADSLARQVIERAGYGDKFGHSLGHGIGLAVHEHPRVGPNATSVLQDNMVFTIEPGIYIPGWGGVRIEDMVVLERGKARLLTHASKTENPKEIKTK